MTDESFKRGLQKLLREFDSNSGMAGFVCGRPVELMPQGEQDRIINGFCTRENLEILAESQQRLEAVSKLDISEDEAKKVGRAIPILRDLVEVFALYTNSKVNREELRSRVRAILHNPIPGTHEGLIEAIPKLIEAVEFLAEQKVEQKDKWDRMVDCAQMHDVLSRVKEMCTTLSGSGSGVFTQTAEISAASLAFLEAFFKGEIELGLLDDHFQGLSAKLSELWGE